MISGVYCFFIVTERQIKEKLQWGLATLLEGAGCDLNILNFKFQNLNRLWRLKCYKLESESIVVKCNVSTILADNRKGSGIGENLACGEGALGGDAQCKLVPEACVSI